MFCRGFPPPPRGAKPFNEGDSDNFLAKAHTLFCISNPLYEAGVNKLSVIY